MEHVINANEGDTMNEVSVLHLPVEDAVNEVVHGLEGVALKHSDSRLPFQIFPDPCEEEEVPVKMRGRLPSIVVEPIDIIDVESGELRWPPESLQKEKKEDMLEEDVEEETTDEQTGKPKKETEEATS
ncbi:protein LBH-like isoform X2 [Spea bombifrons]|uniref:protein LBH-like isoform X2 n=1 Tax=Spea bombifrons TaxID=233779 RepID=UPI0023494BB0|nr:protein LBH-like isoform X2 [Spea bombifrons]